MVSTVLLLNLGCLAPLNLIVDPSHTLHEWPALLRLQGCAYGRLLVLWNARTALKPVDDGLWCNRLRRAPVQEVPTSLHDRREGVGRARLADAGGRDGPLKCCARPTIRWQAAGSVADRASARGVGRELRVRLERKGAAVGWGMEAGAALGGVAVGLGGHGVAVICSSWYG